MLLASITLLDQGSGVAVGVGTGVAVEVLVGVSEAVTVGVGVLVFVAVAVNVGEEDGRLMTSSTISTVEQDVRSIKQISTNHLQLIFSPFKRTSSGCIPHTHNDPGSCCVIFIIE